MQTELLLATRTIPSGYNKRTNLTLRVEGGLHYVHSSGKPYFTLTVMIHRKGHPNQCRSGGCDHETILRYYPQFADLAALHLSDIDGVPMHAEANGWYNLAGVLPGNAGERDHTGNSKRYYPKPEGATDTNLYHPPYSMDYRNPTSDECLQIFANHVRVDMDTARWVLLNTIAVWEDTRNELQPDTLTTWEWSRESWTAARKWFAAWIESQKPRWKVEADACIAKHGLLVFGDKWEKGNTQ